MNLNFTTVQHKFVVEEHTKGLMFQNVPENATIRIDVENDLVSNGNYNVFPEMTFKKYAELFGQVSTTYPILSVIDVVGVSHYKDFKFPFTTGKSIELNDDVRYVVTVDGNTATNSVDVFNLETPLNNGTPIRLSRLDIEGSKTEKNIDLMGAEVLYFPNGLPEKVDFQVPYNGGTRKVTLSQEQLYLQTVSTEIVSDFKGTFISMYDNLALPVSLLRNINIHTAGNGTDFTFYKVELI